MRHATSTCAVAFLGMAAAVSSLIVARAVAQGANRQSSPSQTTSLSPSVEHEIDRVVTEIDQIEARTLAQLSDGLPGPSLRTILLGKLLVYDKHLSVGRNEACAFCHMPETGFTGPISELNGTTVAYPGSVRTRFSQRKPQTHAYAPFAPPLHYNAGQGDFVGLSHLATALSCAVRGCVGPTVLRDLLACRRGIDLQYARARAGGRSGSVASRRGRARDRASGL